MKDHKFKERQESILDNDNLNNEVLGQPDDNTVVILDGYDSEVLSKKMDDFGSYIDDNGERWCSIKEAVRITGKSDATIRRLVKGGEIQSQMKSSPYGDMYVLRQKDVDLIAEAEMMKIMKRDSGKRDLSIEIRKILETYESTTIGPLREDLEGLAEEQTALQIRLDSELGATNEQLENITAQNQELLDSVKKLTTLVEEQQTQIDEQKEYIDAQKNKGFWGRLFGK